MSKIKGIRMDKEKILQEYIDKHPEYIKSQLDVDELRDTISGDITHEFYRITPKGQRKWISSELVYTAPKIYGYARVSTKGQAKDGNSLEAQTAALKAAGAEEIYSDAYTGTTNERPELDKLLKKIHSDDTLVVTKLDRIARNLKNGLDLIDELADKGVKLNILNMGIIDDSVQGKLIRNIMLAFAEYEREMILQRTREGKEIAKQNSEYRDGRKPKFSNEQIEHALKLLESHSYSQVVRMTGISKSTLIRAQKKHF